MELDDETLEQLGPGRSTFFGALELTLPKVERFREWRKQFAATEEGKATIKKKRARDARKPHRVLKDRARNKKWREKPEVKERRLKYMRQYISAYRATAAGKAATKAATKKFRKSAKGKAARKRWNRDMYLRNKEKNK